MSDTGFWVMVGLMAFVSALALCEIAAEREQSVFYECRKVVK